MKICKIKVSRRKIFEFCLSILTALGILLVLGAVGDADNGVPIEDVIGRIFVGGLLTSCGLLVANWMRL